MGKVRLIPRLDIKGPNLIKGIQLEGLRIIGNPNEFAKKYYEQGADELLYMDSVASLYNRDSIKELIKDAAKNVFIPITVGGGIRSIKDAKEIFKSGADKIAINTGVVKKPQLLKDLANKFGSQSVVVSIEAKKISENEWEVLIDHGRERTGIKVLDWVKKTISMGAGEILLTSVDKEGTKKGFDIDLIKSVTGVASIPVIASGGMGKASDFISAVLEGKVDAVSMASILHYNIDTIQNIKLLAKTNNVKVRSDV
tara:strand:+ start:575 stop:1339 length:765 start_codon:yes stop_codon:yes gene_type:complete